MRKGIIVFAVVIGLGSVSFAGSSMFQELKRECSIRIEKLVEESRDRVKRGIVDLVVAGEKERILKAEEKAKNKLINDLVKEFKDRDYEQEILR